MLTKIKATLLTGFRVFRAGAWVSTLSLMLSLLSTPGILDSGQVGAIRDLAAALLNVAATATAVVHAFHIKTTFDVKAVAAEAVAAAKAAEVELPAHFTLPMNPPAAT